MNKLLLLHELLNMVNKDKWDSVKNLVKILISCKLSFQ